MGYIGLIFIISLLIFGVNTFKEIHENEERRKKSDNEHYKLQDKYPVGSD